MEKPNYATISEKLAEFTVNFSNDYLPDYAREDVKLRFVDTLGNALLYSKMEQSLKLLEVGEEYFLPGPDKHGTVFGMDYKLSAPTAAFFNSVFAHGLQYDDVHQSTGLHPSCFIVPAALALGETVGASGREVITVASLGYEISTRLALAISSQNNLIGNGLSPTGLLGSITSSLLASKMFGLTKEQTMNALGIGANFNSNLLQSTVDGSFAKIMHPGWSSKAGITAAMLASRGITGPEKIFEGHLGFNQAYFGNPRLNSGFFDDLGINWNSCKISFKPYPCCFYIHPYMEAAFKLVQNHGIKPGDIESVECCVNEIQSKIICEPWEEKINPKNTYASKYSLPFAVALVLSRNRAGIEEFDSAFTCTDHEIKYLMSKIYSIIKNNEEDLHRVTVKTRDGSTFTARESGYKGSLLNPMQKEDIIEKFKSNIHTIFINNKSVYGLLNRILNLEEVKLITDFTREWLAQQTRLQA